MLRYWTGLYNGRVPYYFPYFLFKIIYYLFKGPFILGSILEFIGYFKARFFDRNKPFPKRVSQHIIKIQKQKIIKRGINRNDVIYAFGGGVVGDLAGFLSSIILRGVPK